MLSRLNHIRTALFSFARPTMSHAVDTSHYRAALSSGAQSEIATFAAGCFWGVEHIFLKEYPPSQNKGILKTSVGYTGGLEKAQNPTYREVCTGTTDHAEALRIEFDPSIIQYGELVEFFYRTHDPTTPNRQGGDVGTQYRSVIFTHSPEQSKIAEDVTRKVQEEHFKGQTIATEIKEAGQWYDAEEYHQLYLFKEPNGYQCPTHKKHW
ncbi:peptide methionine sulfoxide reductase MsrA [Suillus fuscotomentosus]|uniref:peptide-methionine (S)-S-oxide reductase n=1 Tax=Suillus fuscotomentosus TaxID=1912939 RepID=A0AAD4DS05_9AGAM|nr:peptide methionine sulfoxide reductase MsrA [Suillus fuscotomentosus]KAG1821382.1 peptide methionine sulfoxide reductase MsrA [Suillus variegatus]KAG1892866.1 peptide methionine sulfoxide reductase MsrA [Suillus fuscotomentosus]